MMGWGCILLLINWILHYFEGWLPWSE